MGPSGSGRHPAARTVPQPGLSWYGSVTATAHGAAFSQSMAGNEPRMMIDTGDVAGVPVNGNSGVTNRFGVGVVSAGSSYRRSDISVDVAALPEDVDVSSSVISRADGGRGGLPED